MATQVRSVGVLVCALLGAAAVSAFSTGLERMAQAGGVTGVATPINFQDATASTIDFKLALDTHSVPLAFDVAKIAVLGDGKQVLVPASNWSGGRGGHHLSGALSFPAGELRSVETLVLTLKIAGEAADLTFRWKGPFISASMKVSMPGRTYTNVAPGQLAVMLQKKDFFLVNTHVPYAGEIAGTDAFIPYDETASRLKQYPADKTAKIVLYCRSGHMSDIAARELVSAGFTNVINLSGGMIAWEDAGYQILDKGTQNPPKS